MLSLQHKPELEHVLQQSNVRLSEYCFACLYLFRSLHKYELICGLDMYIKGVTYDGLQFLMPTSLKSFISLLNEAETHAGIDILYPIPEEWLQVVDYSRWQVGYNENDSDYIFDTLHLSKYEGRGLSKKRNLVKQFLDSYQVSAKPLDETTSVDALQLLDIWNSSASGDHLDTAECTEAIQAYKKLGLDGTIYYVGTKAVGFVIGQKLCSDTYVLHFVKADVSYKGIYQYMYQAFAKTKEPDFAFINMEQDLGSPALRQAKHSYEPLRMGHKYRLTLIK